VLPSCTPHGAPSSTHCRQMGCGQANLGTWQEGHGHFEGDRGQSLLAELKPRSHVLRDFWKLCLPWWVLGLPHMEHEGCCMLGFGDPFGSLV
jgi:hypothetical protein